MDVYFDDMGISQTKSPVLQYNEYYPFGLQTMNSWTRENNSNNFLFNSGTELNGTTGLYDLAFRNYDPVLGCFAQVDALADQYGGLTPYNYAANDPVYFNDPQGLSPNGKAVCLWCGGPRPNDHDYPNVEGNDYGAAFDSNWSHIPTSLAQQRLADRANAGDEQARQEYNERYSDQDFRIIDYYTNGDRNRYIDTEIIIGNGVQEQQTQTGPFQDWLPTPAELEERFGKSFKEDFVGPLKTQFENKQFSPRDLANHIEGFDFEGTLKDSKSQYQLRPVFGRLAVGTPASPLFNETLFNVPIFYQFQGPNGVVNNPGTSIITFLDGSGNYVGLVIKFNVIIPH